MVLNLGTHRRGFKSSTSRRVVKYANTGETVLIQEKIDEGIPRFRL